MGRVPLRILLGPSLLLSIALSQDCSASEFACSGASTNTDTIAPSWCSSSNPLIVARPPSAISEGSDLGGAPFYCPHGDGSPFEQCFLVRLSGKNLDGAPSETMTSRADRQLFCWRGAGISQHADQSYHGGAAVSATSRLSKRSTALLKNDGSLGRLCLRVPIPLLQAELRR